MDKSLSSGLLSLQSISADYHSTDFLLMMIRVLAQVAAEPSLRVWLHDPELDAPLRNWMHEEQARNMKSNHPFFYLVSGEMDPHYCNEYDMDLFYDILEHKERYPSFAMKGMTSPFVVVAENNVRDDDPVAVHTGKKRLGNNIFSLFYRAAQRRDSRFALFRTERRLACHWTACGGRMAVADVCSSLIGAESYPAVFKMACVEGPLEVVARIAEEEFQNSATLATDTAHTSQLVLDHMDEKAKEAFMHNNMIIPHMGCSMLRLKPGKDDMTPVRHFHVPMHKVGDFLLATGENVVRAVNKGDRFENECVRFDQHRRR